MSVPDSPPSGGNVELGEACIDQYLTPTSSLIGDGGPNAGYRYVASAGNSSGASNTTFNYIISGYLDDANSQFAQAQYGNYDPSTKTGFISYVQLKSNTYEHESGNTTGHYAQYTSTQNDPANNVGMVVEAQTGAPGQSATDFNTQIQAAATAAGTAIVNATVAEACNHDVSYDKSCTFRGFINWPPYQARQ
jgi:hypothetical protein